MIPPYIPFLDYLLALTLLAAMETRSRSTMAVGLGLVFWMFLLFSPLAWVGQARADDVDNYGTVIGIVSIQMDSTPLCLSHRAEGNFICVHRTTSPAQYHDC